MATNDFIKSLNLEENIFELREDTVLKYLVHLCAPGTGAGEIKAPAGIRFAPHGPMREDALYMHMVEENEALLEKMLQQEKKIYDELAIIISGFSFYITEDEINNGNFNFISGSKERLLEIVKLLRE